MEIGLLLLTFECKTMESQSFSIEFCTSSVYLKTVFFVDPIRTLNVYPNAVMGKFIPFCSPADLLAASVLMQHAVHIEPHGMIFNAATGLQTTRGDNRVEVKRIRDSVLSRVGATEPEMLRDLGAYFRLKCDQCGQYNLKNRLCSRCGLAAYCSVECQKADWSNHKAFCKTKPK